MSMRSGQLDVMCFAGYDLDDRRFQLNTRTSVYRSFITKIRYEHHEYLYRNRFINIEIQTLGTTLCFGQIFHVVGKPESNINNIHIICKNNISIDLCALDDVSTQSVSQSSITSKIPTQRRQLSANISWPNGLQIKTIASSISDKSNEIVQSWMARRRCNEIKRIFRANVGAIVIYYDDGTIKVLTSTGVTYETANEYETMDDTDMPMPQHNQLVNDDEKGGEGKLLQFFIVFCCISSAKH